MGYDGPMEMDNIKRVIARRHERSDDLVETLRFHEVLFEELGCEVNLMADIIMAMDLKIDRLEEEVDRFCRDARFRRLGKPSSL